MRRSQCVCVRRGEGGARTTAAPGPVVRGKGGTNVHKLPPMSSPPAPNRRVRRRTGAVRGELDRADGACSGPPESRGAPAWFRASEGDRCPSGEGPRGRRSSTSGEKGKRRRRVWPSRHAQRAVYNPFRAAFAGSLSSVYASFIEAGVRPLARLPTALRGPGIAGRSAQRVCPPPPSPPAGPTFTGARRRLPICEYVSHIGFRLRPYTVPALLRK